MIFLLDCFGFLSLPRPFIEMHNFAILCSWTELKMCHFRYTRLSTDISSLPLPLLWIFVCVFITLPWFLNALSLYSVLSTRLTKLTMVNSTILLGMVLWYGVIHEIHDIWQIFAPWSIVSFTICSHCTALLGYFAGDETMLKYALHFYFAWSFAFYRKLIAGHYNLTIY